MEHILLGDQGCRVGANYAVARIASLLLQLWLAAAAFAVILLFEFTNPLHVSRRPLAECPSTNANRLWAPDLSAR